MKLSPLRSNVYLEHDHVVSHHIKVARIMRDNHLNNLHNCRQKLKAKLVRSVQDSKTLQSQLQDTQEALERESAGKSILLMIL